MCTQRPCGLFVAAGLITAAAVAQTAEHKTIAPGFIGEITATNVYVRSGPSTNYYEVTKLSPGDRVSVYREENGWYAIGPPKGCFSLIHKNFVDSDASGAQGVVNGDAVLVRAGSELKTALYAKQLKLSRGAMVKIIKSHNQDYLRIEPPPGVRLYVHSRYVERVPESRLALEAAVPGAASFTGSMPSDEAADRSAAGTQDRPPLEPGKFRGEIAKLDAAVEAETQKPLLQRDYNPLIERFHALVQQQVDPYARAYAKARIDQLTRTNESADAVRYLRKLADQITTDRKDALIQRTRIRPPAREIGGGFDAVGELRPSVLFNSAARPRWYRLVAQDTSPLRTIGYVEIPNHSNIDITRFLGRKVGVRARERRILTGDVDPLEVFVASELIVLDATQAPETGQQPTTTEGNGG